MINSIVRGSIETNSFAYMHIGAKHMLKQAEESSDGQLYNLISCLTFSAFTLEAYFNHLGKIKESKWDKIERKYSKLNKFKLFCKNLKIDIDFTKRPHSTIIELFEFRDTLAHGKSTVDSITKKIQFEPQHPNRFIACPEWMEYANIENAKKAINDIELIIIELHSAGGYSENPFSNLGGGMFGIQIF